MGYILSCLSKICFRNGPQIKKQQNITLEIKLTYIDIYYIKNKKIPPSCETIMSSSHIRNPKLSILIYKIQQSKQLTPSEKNSCLEMIYSRYKELDKSVKCTILRHLCFNNKSIANKVKNEFDSFEEKTSHTFKEFLNILYKTDPRDDMRLSPEKITMLQDDLSETIKKIVSQCPIERTSIYQFKFFVTKKTFTEMTYSSDYKYWDSLEKKLCLPGP